MLLQLFKHCHHPLQASFFHRTPSSLWDLQLPQVFLFDTSIEMAVHCYFPPLQERRECFAQLLQFLFVVQVETLHVCHHQLNERNQCVPGRVRWWSSGCSVNNAALHCDGCQGSSDCSEGITVWQNCLRLLPSCVLLLLLFCCCYCVLLLLLFCCLLFPPQFIWFALS